MSDICQVHAKELADIANRLGDEFESEMKKMSDDFEGEVEDITDDMPDTDGVDASIGLEFDVEWNIKTIKLHLPEVEMKLQSWHFDLPSVTMKNKRIVFHTPSVRMKRKKVGQYPEVHGFTVKWKNIYVDVPEPFMEKQELVMGIPEIRMEEQTIKLHVPEFAMRLQTIKLHLPEFKLRSIEVASDEVKDRAEEASEEFQGNVDTKKSAFFEKAKGELVPAASLLFSCHRTQIQNQKEQTMASFEPAIVQMRNAISKLDNAGATDKASELKSQLNDVLNKQKAAAANFDSSIEALLTQEKNTVNRILSAFSVV